MFIFHYIELLVCIIVYIVVFNSDVVRMNFAQDCDCVYEYIIYVLQDFASV